jgi:photosystem II stability/assembly factor-like uncharacterized protein
MNTDKGIDFSKRLVPSIILAVLLLAAAPAAEGAPLRERWSPLGPTGGTITALAVAPGARRTLYAGTQDGAVFRSEDAGAHWVYAGSNLTNVRVNDLEVDPRTSATVYAASCEFGFEPPFQSGGLLKSTDGGRSWALLELDILFDCSAIDLAIDPHDPDTVVAATVRGFFESHDGGATWELAPEIVPPAEFVDSAHAVTFDPAAPGTLYVLRSGIGFQKSTDGGASWTTLSAGLPAAGFLANLELDPGASDTLYIRTVDPAAAPDPGVASVYRSDDGGATWTAAAAGLAGRRVLDLAVARAAPALYATTADGVFRSQDRGRSWTGPVPGTAGALVVAAPPSPAGIVYAGATLRGVLKSFDRGATWRAVNRGLHGLGVSRLAIAPSDPAVFYATVRDLGVLRSGDGGANWRPAGGGLGFEPFLLAVDPHDPQTVFASRLAGGLWKTSDGGASWRATAGDTTCTLVQEIVFDPRGGGTVYAAGTRGVGLCPSISAGACKGFRSTDGGESWTCMEELAREVHSLAIDPADPARLYAGGFFEIQTTTDAGLNWSDASAGLPVVIVQSLALTPRAPGIVFAGTSSGLFRRTGGGAWSRYLPELFTTWTDLTVAPSAPAVLYAQQDSTGPTLRTPLYRSVDAGASWRRLTERGLPAGHSIFTVVVDPAQPRVIYTLAAGAIYRLSRPAAP